MARILSVSYHESLLESRRLLLEAKGYNVISALGFSQAILHCKQGGFDLFILGHSIPLLDKQELIREFRAHCPSPIISLTRVTEPPVDGANFHVYPDPKALLETVAQILNGAKGKQG